MNVSGLFKRCGAHQEAISLLATNRLPEAEQASLELHLARCADCRNQLAGLRALSKDLTAWKSSCPMVEPSPKFEFRLRQALRDTQLEGRASAGSASGKLWGGLGAKRLLWGGVAAVWGAILFLNWDAPQMTTMARNARPVSAKRLLMALKAYRQEARSLQVESSKESTPPPAPGLSPHTWLRQQNDEPLTQNGQNIETYENILQA